MKSTITNTFLLGLLLTMSAAATADCVNNVVKSTPTYNFTLNQAEATDNKHGLIWQRCSGGQVYANHTCSGTAKTYNWLEALNYAQELSAQTGKNWRVPNIKELQSIVEYSCQYPAINHKVFPNTPVAKFWTSSPNFGIINTIWIAERATYDVWALDFSYGDLLTDGKTNKFHVRLMRSAD